jgi:polyphosphate glucokinase
VKPGMRGKKAGSAAGPAGAGAPFTLAVDIGGTRIKASVLDRSGKMVAPRVEVNTPAAPKPAAVLAALEHLAHLLPDANRISIGFPGVVRGHTVITAPNLGTSDWAGFPLVEAVCERFGRPARMLNDAAVQGLGVVEGPGLECVLTLGTGVGCALFRNRRLLLHLELGQHRARKRLTYDQYIGQAALTEVGAERWNRRVEKALESVRSLMNCERLYIGGGNARKIAFPLPPGGVIVSNTAGVTGGVRLWESDLDELCDPGGMTTAAADAEAPEAEAAQRATKANSARRG